MLGKTDVVDTRSVRRDATRERILKAAWRSVRKDGLASLSLRDLAKAVGMRAPSLYSYFDSKHAIYDAMFAAGTRALAELGARFPDPGSPEERLRTGAREFLRFCVEDPARYQLLFQRTIPDFEPSPESFALSVSLLEETKTTLAELGAEKHLDLYTGLVSGLAAQQNANDPGGDRWTKLVDEAMDMFLAHVAATRGRRKR